MPMFWRVLHSITFLIVMTLSATAQGQGSGWSSRYFEVDTLNAGLPPRPAAVNLDTPQAAMETFLFAGRQKEWNTAAYALDLSMVEPGQQAERGPELAAHLYEVLQTATWLDWNALPDRPGRPRCFRDVEGPDRR